jgi:hypothetical protein
VVFPDIPGMLPIGCACCQACPDGISSIVPALSVKTALRQTSLEIFMMVVTPADNTDHV